MRACALIFTCLLLAPLRAYADPPAESNQIQKSVELISKGDLDGAEKEARLALRDPAIRALASATMGAIRIQQKKYEEGAQFLRTALRINPRLIGARISLGDVYVLQGWKVKARGEFLEALRIVPGNPNGCFALAQLEAGSQNFAASLQAAQPILPELRHSAEGLMLLATDYAGLRKTELLRALVSDWEVLTEVPAALCTDFGSLLAKNGLVQEAIEVFTKAENSGPASYDLARALADTYFATGNLKMASEKYEVALRGKPDCVTCLRQIAKLADQQGDSEKALAYLIRAKLLQPQDAETLFQFGKVCLERDLFGDAVAALQQAVTLQPDNDSYRYVLASAQVSKKQYKEARSLFETLLKKHPDDPVLNYAMGSVLFLQVNLDAAAKYLQKSIDLEPNQLAAYYYLGMVAERKNDKDQAMGIFRDLIRHHPEYAPAYESLGSILLAQRKYPEAQRALEKAVELNPNSVKSHYQLGMLLGRVGKQDESNKELAIAQKLGSEVSKKTSVELHILTPH